MWQHCCPLRHDPNHFLKVTGLEKNIKLDIFFESWWQHATEFKTHCLHKWCHLAPLYPVVQPIKDMFAYKVGNKRALKKCFAEGWFNEREQIKVFRYSYRHKYCCSAPVVPATAGWEAYKCSNWRSIDVRLLGTLSLTFDHRHTVVGG